MPTVITGTDGINQVQAGAVESGDLPAGSVIQVVSTNVGTLFSTSLNGVNDINDLTPLNASITPKSSSNKILIFVNLVGAIETNTAPGLFHNAIKRNGTVIPISDAANNRIAPVNFRLNTADGAGSTHNIISYFDSPNTTSAVNYQVTVQQGATGGSIIFYLNGDSVGTLRGASSITLMEVAG